MSGTGLGEQFVRHMVAHDVAARLRYLPGATLESAARQVVFGTLETGDGGVIAVDRDYNISMAFNSSAMYRGAADSNGRFEVAVLPDSD